MLIGLHALALAVLLVAPDTSGLQFLGFRAGAHLDELQLHLRSLKGSPLRCRKSRADRRVSECRAALRDPELGGTLDVWISAIDSVAGVIILSRAIAPDHLEQWRLALQQRYGVVGKHVQGIQSMQQWVRRGRMLRLTWRAEAGGRVASVSLVDGHVLDDWGRARSRSLGPSPSVSRIK
jgi:hypothetical protein